ncbi:hypothetical protein RIF29_25874 [Crotalaria pallida]|uniref:Uncharacterized protein n=1 Tax=Crotalaria pallida TaxID=3830 RepID=A0AAN9HZJ7_CROPI
MIEDRCEQQLPLPFGSHEMESEGTRGKGTNKLERGTKGIHDAIVTGATGISADNYGGIVVSQGAGASSGDVAKSTTGGVGESSGVKVDVIPETSTSAEEGEWTPVCTRRKAQLRFKIQKGEGFAHHSLYG